MRYIEYGAVVPAYNEEHHIGEVLSSLKEYFPASNIVVIDDGSGDDTASLAEREGVVVIRHQTNRGKGASLRRGFAAFSGKSGIKGMFTIDADGQHAPSEIPRFIECFEGTGADIVIGDRMSETSGMPLVRRLTNILTSRVISLRAGCRIEDSQSGYRLIGTSILQRIDLVTEHFETESEILIKAARAGASIGSVRISTIYADETSRIDPLRDTARFFKLVFKSYFW